MTHIFDLRCRENGIEHRLTKVTHPWTNGGAGLRLQQANLAGAARGGQVERMNRTIKEATVKWYHYDDHEQLRSHLADFINAYNYGRRLKALKGLMPFEYVRKIWANEPERFNLNPLHQSMGPYT